MLNAKVISRFGQRQCNSMSSMVNKQNSASPRKAIRKGIFFLSSIKTYCDAYFFYLLIKLAAFCIYTIDDAKRLDDVFPDLDKILHDYTELYQSLPADAKFSFLGWVIRNIKIELEDIAEHLAVNTDTELGDLMNNFVQKLPKDV